MSQRWPLLFSPAATPGRKKEAEAAQRHGGGGWAGEFRGGEREGEARNVKEKEEIEIVRERG
ncbi:hypothetical protein NL676_001041, partial [Syzygium grande]